MNWYLIHTKPRQEQYALLHLEQQGYPCYLPVLHREKVRSGQIIPIVEPLFPRYLFIQLDHSITATSWAPIRSTKGVNRLVRFGKHLAKVSDQLITDLRALEQANSSVAPLFQPGQRVRIQKGPLSGIEGVFQMSDGDQRVLILIEVMGSSAIAPVTAAHLQAIP